MPISLEFLPVGESHGDAIIVKHGDQNGWQLTVVDGGYTEIGETMIDHLLTHYGKDVFINNMVVTHPDNDHVKGLIPVFKRFRVDALWMNRPWLYAQEVLDQFHPNWTLEGWVKHVRDSHECLVELEKLAYARKIIPRELFQGSIVGPFIVLAPSKPLYLSLIPDLDKTPPPYKSEAPANLLMGTVRTPAIKVPETLLNETLDPNPPVTSAANETSAVLYSLVDGKKILLTADAGPKALLEAARYASSISLPLIPHKIQIPHQGSRRNISPAALNAWLGRPNGGTEYRGDALVMVGSNKPDHPRKKVVNAFIRRGYNVYISRSSTWMYSAYGYTREMLAIPPASFSTEVEED